MRPYLGESDAKLSHPSSSVITQLLVHNCWWKKAHNMLGCFDCLLYPLWPDCLPCLCSIACIHLVLPHPANLRGDLMKQLVRWFQSCCCLMHRSVTFDFQFELGIKPSGITFCPCLTASAKQWTMHPVPHPLTGYLANSTCCLAYFSLLLGKGAYPMKRKQIIKN